MIDQTRTELLQVLVELSEVRPEVRFGQLVVNLATMARGAEIESTWDIEDDELLAVAVGHLEALSHRLPEPTAEPAVRP